MTSAEKKSIGFDYQYYYFIYLLLGLKSGEKIGYEVKDDIHIEKSDGTLILLQLKHSLQQKSKGDIINFTEKDLDLWKTLYNWIKVIKDKVGNRETLENQLEFISNTEFIIISNKSYSEKNNFLLNLEKIKNDEIDFNDFKLYLKELLDKSKKNNDSKNVRYYLEDFIGQRDELIIKFLQKIEISLNKDKIINLIMQRLKRIVFQDDRLEDVFDSIFSNVSKEKYFLVKSNKKIIITYEEFGKRYKNCFGKSLNWKLQIKEIETTEYSFDYEKALCIRQILDLDEINNDEKLEIMINKLKLENNIGDWEQKGLLTSNEIKKFHEESINIWKGIFRKKHRKSKNKCNVLKNEEIDEISLGCLDEIRCEQLEIDGQRLGLEVSNGEFYFLSNVPKIGWHLKWEEK